MESEELKKAGLKVTMPRKMILEILESSDAKHLSAEDIYRIASNDYGDISLGTIYRVLTQFETAGLVIRHSFNGNAALFELASEGSHEHMVCTKCGYIFEFQDDSIEERMTHIAKRHNLRHSSHTLIMYADCLDKDCRRQGG